MTFTPYSELYMDQGADFSTIVDISSDVDFSSVNINNVIFTSQMKKSILSQNVSANIVCSIVDGTGGEMIMTLDAANTATLQPGRYVFDVLMIDTSEGNLATRLMEGLIVVSPGVTGITV
jgi:hypothetical protein